MSTVEDIEAAIEQLPRNDLFRLKDWLFSKFEKEWDKQLEEDIKAGRLDHLAQEALAEYRAGRTTSFPPSE